MTIEELKPLMRIPADASKKKVMRTFERIAEVLMNGCVLTKCGSVPNFFFTLIFDDIHFYPHFLTSEASNPYVQGI